MKRTQPEEVFAIPRDITLITEKSGNIYKSLVIMSKRANMIARSEREEIQSKLAEFQPRSDTLEEVYDNKEQMEMSAHYEVMPKPTLVALHELFNDRIYFREIEPVSEKEEDDKIIE